jgi:hypothetical protein
MVRLDDTPPPYPNLYGVVALECEKKVAYRAKVSEGEIVSSLLRQCHSACLAQVMYKTEQAHH